MEGGEGERERERETETGERERGRVRGVYVCKTYANWYEIATEEVPTDKMIKNALNKIGAKGFTEATNGEEMVREADKKDPCWDGYQKEGLKTKKGKEVPNCVKK